MSPLDRAAEREALVGRSVPRIENHALLASACLARPDVAAVITGEDMRRFTDPMKVAVNTPMEYRCLALDRVRFVGEPVAVVLAPDRYRAEDALDDVKVEYRPLPAVVDPVEALADDAPVLHPKIGSNLFSHHEFRHGRPCASRQRGGRVGPKSNLCPPHSKRLWIQFALAVSVNVAFRQCAWCPTWFPYGGRQGVGRRRGAEYCSDRCRKAAIGRDRRQVIARGSALRKCGLRSALSSQGRAVSHEGHHHPPRQELVAYQVRRGP